MCFDERVHPGGVLTSVCHFYSTGYKKIEEIITYYNDYCYKLAAVNLLLVVVNATASFPLTCIMQGAGYKSFTVFLNYFGLTLLFAKNAYTSTSIAQQTGVAVSAFHVDNLCYNVIDPTVRWDSDFCTDEETLAVIKKRKLKEMKEAAGKSEV